MKRQRKTRITKELVHQMQETRKIKAQKNVIIPGPWTNVETELKVKPELRLTDVLIGQILGHYRDDEQWREKGWYPISINITSSKIKRDVEKYGIAEYLSAWEKAINDEKLANQYGTIILLNAMVDHSHDENENHRFISCLAKTNKKSIPGFGAIRKAQYIILGKNDE